MTPEALVADLRRRGVRVASRGTRLLIDAPKGALTDELRAEVLALKSALVDVLNREEPGGSQSLADYAADRLPRIKFTIRETGDTKRDFDLLGRVRQAIEGFQPGGNHIYLTIVTLDKRRVVVEWRALADRNLRLALAGLLARTARRE